LAKTDLAVEANKVKELESDLLHVEEVRERERIELEELQESLVDYMDMVEERAAMEETLRSDNEQIEVCSRL
jgi:hypothetical protein